MNLSNTTPIDLQGIFAVTAHDTDASNRRTQLEQIYLSHYPAIREGVQDAGPNLFVQDVDSITAGIADHLDQFTGPLEDFIPWALALATESAEQASAFIAMRAEHSENVRRAIRSVIASCTRLGATLNGQPPDELGAELDETNPEEEEQARLSTLDTVDEIEQTVWLRVLADLPNWLSPSYSNTPGQPPASLKTRLWGFSRLQALGWRTTQLREFARYASLDYEESENTCK